MPIGEWVLRTACAQNKAWQDAGLPPVADVGEPLGAPVPQHDLVALGAERCLARPGSPPRLLELELTESLITQRRRQGRRRPSSALKAAGVRLLDRRLRHRLLEPELPEALPVDTLKIDQSFVRDMLDRRDDAAIAQAIISLAHSLALKVIAEGVETAEQRVPAPHGCDEVQGYYFSKPVPAAEMEAMLKNGKRLP